MSRQTITVWILVLASASALRAQTARPPQADAVDAIFAEWSGRNSVGCAVGVALDGRFLYKAGYGSANLDWHVPITASTVFYVGSVSKQFTATAVALLAEDGRLSLDDDIRAYLPELPKYPWTVTIRHLLHHTAGIPDMYEVMERNGLDWRNRYAPEEGLALMAEQPLSFPPGERYEYSNGGYFLLAQIVERASGQSLRAFANDRIFGPLGMLDTHFHDDAGHIVEGRAMSYEPGPDGRYRQSYANDFALPGAGGLYTTVEDLLLWERNLLDDRLGGPALMETLHARGVLNDGSVLPYALALRHGEHRGLEWVGHTGSMMGFKAAYVRFPEQGLGVWTLCNYGPMVPQEYSLRVADVFLGRQIP